MPKIIITGGAGFIGSHLVDKLFADGHEILIIDNFSTGKRSNIEHLKNKVTILELDLSERGNLNDLIKERKVFEGIDYIFHLAALPRVGLSLEKPIETHKVNVGASLNMLELARIIRPKKFIYASSSSVYGQKEILPMVESMDCDPENLYATQKLIGEFYCKVYAKVFRIQTIALRLFNAYGPRMVMEGAYKLVLANWIEQVKKGESITIYGDGEQTRDFTYIDDVVKALIATMNEPSQELPKNKCVVLNVCTNTQISVNKLAEFFGYPGKYVENPRPQEEKKKEGSYALILKLFNWRPEISIEEGVEKIKREYNL